LGTPCGTLADKLMLVEIESKSYGEDEILGDISFRLEPGSFTVLTGPSGCGKTTLLRILAGLDHDWCGRMEGAENIAYIFQEPRLLPWRSLLDNIRLAAAPAGYAGDAQAALAMVGLEEYADSYPGALSMGMARRAGLARALAVRPASLLMDEPFVSLDETAAAKLREMTLELWKASRPTILMVTHDLNEAATLADRILVIAGRPARLVQDVTLEHPRNRRDEPWRQGVRERLRHAMA
jgi:ABC-type nitrate/sulfonate/bicarbonate transport system ATPase subunit